MKSTERRHGVRSQRGLTLIETVVALGLFAMSAATMSTFLVTQIRHASNNHLHTRAYALVEDQLEATRAQRFNDMAASTKTVLVGQVSYTVETTVANHTPSNGLKTIDVNVSWNDNVGPRNVAVSTIYTEVRRF